MEELLKKSKINDSKLRTLVMKAVSSSISQLTKPCHYLHLKIYYFEFLKATGLTDKDVKEFVKRRWSGRPEAKLNPLIPEKISNFLIFLIQYYLNKRNLTMYRFFLNYYVIRQYANLFVKHFPKYCSDDVFKYALETLTKTHLFAREKTVGRALLHIANLVDRRWRDVLIKNDMKKLHNFILDTRTRVAQSTRSFASHYYELEKQGKGIQTEIEPSDDEENDYQYQEAKSDKIITNLIRNITVYRYKEIRVQEEARRLSKINSSYATLIVNNLSDVKFSDTLRTIYKKFLEGINKKGQLCGKEFYPYVRNLMGLKRTNEKIYFKQQVDILLGEIFERAEQKENYDKLTSQTQHLIKVFLAYYLTILLKNRVC
jgi:hypothetical protein